MLLVDERTAANARFIGPFVGSALHLGFGQSLLPRVLGDFPGASCDGAYRFQHLVETWTVHGASSIIRREGIIGVAHDRKHRAGEPSIQRSW